MGALFSLLNSSADMKKLREDCPLSNEELETFRMETGFTQFKILRYYATFKLYIDCIAEDKTKMDLTPEEFEQIPCICISPLKSQFIKSIPSKTGNGKHRGNVDFAAFLRLLAVTNGDSRFADKLRFAFNMYDIDGDGKVSVQDVTTFISSVTDFAEQYRAEETKYKELLEDAVKKMFQELGRDEYLRLEDFAQTLMHSDFAHKYQLNINTGMTLKKVQAVIDKNKKDLDGETERLKKEAERRQKIWESSEDGKAELKEKEEKEAAEKKKREEEEETKKKEEEEAAAAKKKKEE